MEKDKALKAGDIRINPEPEYLERKWQGIPGIEKTKKGTLWVAFYSGGEKEDTNNYILIGKSSNGVNWQIPVLVIDPPGNVRAYDPCLWIDPLGRLNLFWSQSYGWFDGRAGVFHIICENPDAKKPIWSKPRRFADGIMMNKPTVLSTGEWLYPVALWNGKACFINDDWKSNGDDEVAPEGCKSHVYISKDNGKTIEYLGSADIPNRTFDEHMVVEKRDGTIWLLVRTKDGIGQSFSNDRGKTWTKGEDSGIRGPNSRFFIRRLNSGNLMLINHDNFNGRNNLTAKISLNDGRTWNCGLLLDERADVSYPDAVQDENDVIYAIYDRERNKAKEILMAKFTEIDILKGKCISDDAQLKILVNKLK